ncbi:neutral alpha-glucosidase AB-like [Macrosteles quadrilineatus]|uniref:neutral alpha-glucosidase AB-like n=1 Tax=Macrosteles quadrilineatus TaxID=74068 RepID=UPI0023E264EF|nr:neutral alpha-glucosidase AB-like [Macrosteles quadrilineatus]
MIRIQRPCFWTFLSVVCLLICHVQTVDRNNFKSCEQSSFCRRCRKMEAGRSVYELQLETLQVTESQVVGTLVNTDNGTHFHTTLTALTDGRWRLEVDEAQPQRTRYRVQHSLQQEPPRDRLEIAEKTENSVTVKCGANKVVLVGAPFRLDVYTGDVLTISANARGLMRFEHHRNKPQQTGEQEGEHIENNEITDPGAWEENYKSHHDSKPRGPEAVALDFSFVGAEQAYGVPEHADSLALKSTGKGDPYRLYNLDVFEYEINNGMALYAAVPFVLAHSAAHSVGVFWHNTAETWVDVVSNSDNNVVSSIVNFVSGSSKDPQVDVHFMSESGIVDVFFMTGPRPHDVFRQYSALTGTAPLPPYFALGYHQCRWNYNDQEDVDMVNRGFDHYDLPMDVIWLDIEHTDNKKYFTWDNYKFSKPTEMQQNLTAVGRKLVVIVDPHIKRDSNYFLHNDATDNGYYVKNKDGSDYEGWCWPGSSSYLDVVNPVVRDYFSSRYSLANYQGSTDNLFIWNDMNEPSVFNGPEVTMPKDCIHHGGWEHRDIHNQYGHLMLMASYNGLLNRAGETDPAKRKRPFILTRSGFAGTQRYAAIWTGDNAAEWSHLAVSIPMCLSLAISGYSFCGADVGGFFKYPDSELFMRWYQTGAFLPFYRAHSHLDTKRREPWLYDAQTLAVVRDSLRLRYTFLPYWYTVFYQHNMTGAPVIRPLWAEFPEDRPTFTIDNQLMIGNAIMARPVTESKVQQVSVYFPGADEIWYDLDTFQAIHTHSVVNIPVDIHKVPHYQRGGTIVPRRFRVRRSSSLTHEDPYTLIVALGINGTAHGNLYIDDGETFQYLHNQGLYLDFKFENNQLTSSFALPNHHYPTKAWLERVVIVGLPPGTKKAKAVSSDGKSIELETLYDSSLQLLTVRKPGLSMASEWKITLL